MKKNIIYAAVILLFTVNAFSQGAKLAKADKEYDKYAYIDAIKTYERVVEKGYKSADLYQKIGNAYYFNAEFAKANKWYAELFALNADQDPEYYYRYSQTLKSIGEYDKANEILAKFTQKNNTDSRGKLYTANKNYLDVIKQNSGRYTIDNSGINSEYSDYGSSFYNNKLVFASSRDTSGIIRRKFQWTNQSFTSLYAAEIKPDGTLGEPEKFSKKTDSRFHESTPVFTKDGKTMYFTRNNYNDGKKGKDSKKITLLKIYKAVLEDDKWTNVTELPFNNDNYSVAHPALSSDEKTLYFASDMPGTLGQSDLFKVKINADGTFGTPENLGDKINTAGKETFPHISADNELYFASDGQLGLGGLDVFVTQIQQDGTFSEVQNVGTPVNSSSDDFALLIDTNRTGFFSSNREGGSGYDDIYKFKENTKLVYKCEQLLAGIITDAETGAILANAKVTLFDKNFKSIKVISSDASGNYSFDVVCGKSYYVRVEMPEYGTKEQRINIPKTSGATDLPFALEKNIKEVTVGSDLAKTFNIEIIYFDLDKSNIREDAAIDLAKIIDVMKQYPNMKVDVRSHTDSRASNSYNDKLSDRRAKSTIAYMVSHGIDANRLTGKGYGESQLVNKCADGVECSEAEHQKNRRSEFIIVAM